MGKDQHQPTNVVARERLKAVLEVDRGHLSGRTLTLFKRDVADVMQSYMEIEEAAMEVSFERSEGGRSIMIMRLPVGKLRKMPLIASEEEEKEKETKR